MDYSKTISAARYECIVCHLKSVTIAELHRHQTFRHTTEELSLSVIGLRSSLNYGAIGMDNGAFARSWLCEPQKRSAFYAYSSILLGHENDSAIFDRSVPLDCVVDKKDFQAELDVESSGRPSDGRPEKIPHWRPSQQRPKRVRALNNGVLDLSRPRKYAKKKQASIDGDRKFLETNPVPETAAGTVSRKKSPKSSRKCKTTSIHRRTVKFEDQAEKGGKEKRKDEKEKVTVKTAGLKYRRSECQDGRGQSKEKERKRRKEEKDRAVKDDRKNPKRRRNSKLLIRRKGSRSGKMIPDRMDVCDEIAVETEKARGSKRKGSSRRKKRSSHLVSPKTSTRVRKIASASENEEISWTGNYEISNDGEVRVDRASLDVAEDSLFFQDVVDTTGLKIHPQNLVPDVAQEVCVGDTWTDSSPINDDETSRPATEHFGTVESFPPYPGDMDDRTILVLDPTTCKLVWSSFELLDDSISAISDENYQNTEDPVFVLESDSLVHHNYVVSDNTRSSRSSRKALLQEDDKSTGNEAQEPQLETNGSTLTNEENASPRSSRFGSTGPRLLLEKFKQENTSSPPRQQELRRNKKLLEKEENLPDPNASHGSKRSASNSRSFSKSNEKRNTLKRSMPVQPQAESNTTLADDEHFIQTIFSQRSKRNRTVTSRYVPH